MTSRLALVRRIGGRPVVGALALTMTAVTGTSVAAGLTTSVVAPAPTGGSDCAPNRLLVPGCGVSWGIYTKQRSAAEGWAVPFVNIEQEIGRRFDLVKRYHDWSNSGGNGQFPDKYEQELGASGGRTLYFAWTSNIWSAGTFATWRDIASGKYDKSIILPEAERLKAWGKPVIIDFDHEMDGWTRTANGTPKDYVDAYRHIHDVMAEAQVDNVIWAWVPTGTMANVSRIKAMYPGNAYVDWVGYDPYNFFRCNGSSWENPYESLAPFYNWLQDNDMAGKPVLLGEYGSVPDPARPQRIKRWYAGLSDALQRLPHIKAVMAWNSRTSTVCDFRVTGSEPALEGFRSAANDPYVTGG